MTGGRAYLLDPDGRHVAALDSRSVTASRLSTAARDREEGSAFVAEFRGLVEAHRDAGSELAARLLAERHELESDIWLVEPLVAAASAPSESVSEIPVAAAASPSIRRAAAV
jgi:glutamate synthase domain-containing protein 3